MAARNGTSTGPDPRDPAAREFPGIHERVFPGLSPDDVVEEHEERYHFAKPYATGTRVLDAACGSGYGTAALASAGADFAIGVELALDVVRYATAQGEDGRVAYLAGDCEALPFADASFDLVVSFETIEHLAHPFRFLKEARRVLRDEGTFILSTPNPLIANFPYGVLRPLPPTPLNPFHTREFTLDELRDDLRPAFDVVDAWVQRPVPLARFLLHTLRWRLGGMDDARVQRAFRNVLRSSPAAVRRPRRFSIASFHILVCRARALGAKRP
jgi:SAM-dependent methyltransferase